MRRKLPGSLDATRVSCLRHFAKDFGPGANETGFSVINLSEDSARRVSEGGIAWLNAQPRGRVDADWSATPVPQSNFRMDHRTDSAAGRYPTPTAQAVLDRYGFGLDVPEVHQNALDAALNAPGSFCAFGPRRLVAVVVPATRRAYVFYAG